MMNQERVPLFEQIRAYAAKQPLRFHVPGHKGKPATFTEADWWSLDVTELPELDDLHMPETSIAEAQQLAAALFGAEETFFLVNGSTVGNLALVMTVCRPGELLLVQRNAHQSVLHGLMLAGARAVFLAPDEDEQSGTALGVRAEVLEEAIRRYPHAKGVLLTNPTYYGATLDLQRHAELAHGAGMVLLVDEAHGAHLGFHPAWPRPAAHCAADAAVQSAHKMLAALTQAGMLHVSGTRLDRGRLRQVLAMLQSTSPSYLLMASLDLARARLAQRGAQAFAELLAQLATFRAALADIRALEDGPDSTAPLFRLHDYARIERFGPHVYAHDPCKLVLHMRETSGFALQSLLAAYGCVVELADERNVLLALSPETDGADFERLLEVLRAIADNRKNLVRATTKSSANGILNVGEFTVVADDAPTPVISQPILFSSYQEGFEVPLSEACGAVAARAITPYPPGIPLVMPGERLGSHHLARLQNLLAHGARVRGLAVRDGVPMATIIRPTER